MRRPASPTCWSRSISPNAGGRRVKGYSMGMRQRLAIAAALLGDPEVLILDEPANGLDPPGIRWMRDLLRDQAGRGRAVLVSSHLLSEVSQSADDLVVMSKGVLRARGPLAEVLGASEGGPVTRARAADEGALSEALRAAGIAAAPDPGGGLIAHGTGTAAVGEAALRGGVPLTELVAVSRSLEDVFLELTEPETGAVRALLAAELIKVRTTRTFFALAGVAIVTSLLLAGLVASLTEPTRDSVLNDVFNSDTSSIFILVLAIVGITGEWRHRTITSSLLAAPDRVRFLLAKTIAFAIAGALLSIAIAIAVSALGLAILSARGLPTPPAGDILWLAVRNAVVAAMLGAFGVGVGALVRNQPVAIVGVFVLALIIEPLLIGLVPSVGRFGPIIALPNGITGAGDATDPFLSPLPSFGLMLAWVVALFAGGATLLRRRDLNS